MLQATQDKQVISSQKGKQLHQRVVDVIQRVKVVINNHKNSGETTLSFRSRFADAMFSLITGWTPMLLYAAVAVIWFGFNLPMSTVMVTFMLAGIAALQAPIIMMSQYRQDQKDSRRLAVNLGVQNEILTLHQSITILMEEQIQQVLENQILAHNILKELRNRLDIEKGEEAAKAVEVRKSEE